MSDRRLGSIPISDIWLIPRGPQQWPAPKFPEKTP